MTTQAIPTKPESLSIYVLHSPSEVRQHAAEMEEYFEAIRKIEYGKRIKAQAIIDEANRPLTEDEYFQEAVKRQKAQDDKQAEREAITKAAALAEIDRLMGSPEIAEVMHRNEYTFLQEVIQWSNRGYVLADNGFMCFMPGMYHINMQAPAATKKAGKQ